jgi:site-specific recombinase XerD
LTLHHVIAAYAAAVAEQGYAHHSIGRQIVAIADFSRWLERKQIEIEALDDQVVDRFLRFRRRQQRVGRGDTKALDRMLSMLRQKPRMSLDTPPPWSCYRPAWIER